MRFNLNCKNEVCGGDVKVYPRAYPAGLPLRRGDLPRCRWNHLEGNFGGLRKVKYCSGSASTSRPVLCNPERHEDRLVPDTDSSGRRTWFSIKADHQEADHLVHDAAASTIERIQWTRRCTLRDCLHRQTTSFYSRGRPSISFTSNVSLGRAPVVVAR